MRSLLTFIIVLNISFAAMAENNSSSQVNAERKARLAEVLKDPKSDLTEKGFAFLFAHLEQIELSGPAANQESLKSFMDNFEAFISNMFSMFSFAYDEEDEEPTNIDAVESYKCEKSGRCHLALKLKNKERRIYSFHVLLDENKIPVAIKDNTLIVE